MKNWQRTVLALIFISSVQGWAACNSMDDTLLLAECSEVWGVKVENVSANSRLSSDLNMMTYDLNLDADGIKVISNYHSQEEIMEIALAADDKTTLESRLADIQQYLSEKLFITEIFVPIDPHFYIQQQGNIENDDVSPTTRVVFFNKVIGIFDRVGTVDYVQQMLKLKAGLDAHPETWVTQLKNISDGAITDFSALENCKTAGCFAEFQHLFGWSSYPELIGENQPMTSVYTLYSMH